MDLIENKSANIEVVRHPWELARYKIISNEVSTILKNKSIDNTIIIDIGCGDAYVISSLTRELNLQNSFAVDINFTDEVIKQLSNQNPQITFLVDFESIVINQNYTYIILLNDVIEHIKEHNEFISKIKNYIINKSAKSYVYITVPAYNFLFSDHDKNLGHYRRYKLKELTEYNNILNMRVLKSGYFFILLFLIRFLSNFFAFKIFFRKNENNIEVSSWNQNKFITTIFTNILIADYYISVCFNKMKIKLPGLSTYIIFEK